MFTTNSFVCYRHLDSRLREGRQGKNTSLNRLRIYSRPVMNEDVDHVCQTCRGDPGAKTVTYI